MDLVLVVQLTAMARAWSLLNLDKLMVGILCRHNYDINSNINLNTIGNAGKQIE